MKSKLFGVMVLAVGMMLSGCGKDNHDNDKVEDAFNKMKNASQNPEAAREMKKEAMKSSLPTADVGTAEDKYVPVDSDVQVAYLYYAVTGMPTDYQKLAGIISRDYNSTSNEFKKKEILDALKPKIDEKVAFFKANRYVKIDGKFELGHIDMATKSFPLSGIPAGDSYIYFNYNSDFKISMTNGDKFKRFSAASDDQARELEDMVGNYKANGKVEMFLFAQDADMSNGTVKFQIVKARLTDRTGKVLGEVK